MIQDMKLYNYSLVCGVGNFNAELDSEETHGKET